MALCGTRSKVTLPERVTAFCGPPLLELLEELLEVVLAPLEELELLEEVDEVELELAPSGGDGD